MDVLNRTLRRYNCILVLVAGTLAGANRTWGQGFCLDSAGARSGFSAESSSDGFHKDEGFVAWNLPWKLDLGRQWLVQPRFDISAGWLGKGGQNAVEGSTGLYLALGKGKFPLWLEGGSEPMLISQNEFGRPGTPGARDFGYPFQFLTHAGIYVNVASKIRLGYRFEHMSNAGIGNSNPGLNLHVFYVGYPF